MRCLCSISSVFCLSCICTIIITVALLLWRPSSNLNDWDHRHRPFVPEYRDLDAVFTTPGNISVESRSENGTENVTVDQSIIIYLTQTEKCLPDFLKAPLLLGNAAACQCEVLVLSFKEKCTDMSLPHVWYIFKPSTSWSAGRNLLYDTAKAKKKFYLYYIFMDDDINLRPMKRVDGASWRIFEQSLRVYQPAVVTIDPHLFYSNSRPKNCQHVTQFAHVKGFDACFNAFHYQAVDLLLPYPTKYDTVSWWYSQLFICIRSDIYFNGDVVGDSRFRAINQKHRGYPRQANKNVVKEIVEFIRKEIPKEKLIKSEPVLQSWIRITKWSDSGELYCAK